MKRRRRGVTAALLFTASTAIACRPAAPTPGSVTARTAPVVVDATELDRCSDADGTDRDAVDPAVSPCDDFYAYACGGWAAHQSIPEDSWRTTRVFDPIIERNDAALREILESLARAPNVTGEERMLGDAYAACIQSDTPAENGLIALEDLLDVIDNVHDSATLARAVARLQLAGVDTLLGITVGRDPARPRSTVLEIASAGRGLPDASSYARASAHDRELHDAYRGHLRRMFALAGSAPQDAARSAVQAYAIEARLAKATRAPSDERQRRGALVTIDALESSSPGIDWISYFSELGVDNVGPLVIREPAQLAIANEIAAQLHRATSRGAEASAVRSYLRARTLDDLGYRLSEPFASESAVIPNLVRGTSRATRPWRVCVKEVESILGDALAQSFIQRQLAPDAEVRAASLVRQLEEALAGSLRDATWMDDVTRERALGKLRALRNQIAHPATPRKYDSLEVGRRTRAKNAIAGSAHELRRKLRLLGSSDDAWSMSSLSFNADYDPSTNQMIVPAAVLQPPLLESGPLQPATYGMAGALVAHELLHAFDDVGRRYDDTGRRVDWWSERASKDYERRAACLVSQFDAYAAAPDLHVDGKLTLGENIADLGGLRVAHRAMHSAFTESRSTCPGARSSEQSFFLAYAQSWCAVVRSEALRTIVKVDPHSPPRFRVNGVLSNMTEFASAFHCAAGTPMAPTEESRCEIF